MSLELVRFEKLLKAIQEERKHEERFFKDIHHSKSLQEKVSTGFVWYPVQAMRKSYTVGEYIEVELERNTDQKISHKFSEGSAALLFHIQSNERTEFKGVVSFVRQHKMRILLHLDHMDRLDIIEKGLLGVEMIYDDKPYKVMESAIKNVMASKHETITYLRSALIKGKIEDHYSKDIVNIGITPLLSLNESQKQAIVTSITAPNIAIVHGPPGTGKTTTLVGLIQALTKNEKRILVCASSNNAVDLLASRLHQMGINVLRIGNITRIHDDLMQLTIEEKVRNHHDWAHIKKVRIQAQDADRKASQFKRNFGPEERDERKELRKESRELRKWASELEDRLMDDIVHQAQVIATTLIGCSNRILDKMYFTTCVIDEASQALEPECWNAMLKANRVILAGDHKQLPPTVKSQEAKSLGLETTILDILADNIPHTSLLNTQYRMHDLILRFSNERFYHNALYSHDTVRNHALRNDHQPLVFIDTAGAGFDEKFNINQRSYSNPGEYFIIREHILLHKENLLGCSIGIISPYNEQVRYIRQEISDDADLKLLDIEVNSIDGFQGQEKEVIYISLVRCNEKGDIGFIKDERRLNVAMTRAMKKLVILGDSATLGQHKLFLDLITFVQESGHYDSAWNYMGY
jgi:superfamily I DNA and/or RNA helicase